MVSSRHLGLRRYADKTMNGSAINHTILLLT